MKYINRIKIGFIFILLCLGVFVGLINIDNENINLEISRYPDGKDFAFTITDDPDYGWLEEKVTVYNLLESLGFKTTIPVWVLDNRHGTGDEGVNSGVGGITTTNEEYLKHTKELQDKGFEIALHTVGPGNDLREETIKGYELFKEQFGSYPKININHTTNLDNIYWGGDRFSNEILRFFYNLNSNEFQGEKEKSQYFWGDIAKEKTKYVRGWATDEINTLSINKSMPYHLSDKHFVNYWFGCSDGYDYDKYIRLISDANIDKLVEQRGTSIIYTHFGYDFVDRRTNTLSEYFITQMTRVSQLNGWFVPVSTILDRFLQLRNVEIINRDDIVLIINHNDEPVYGLTVLTDERRLYSVNDKEWKEANKDMEIILGDLPPYSVFKLGKHDEEKKNESPEIYERINMVWNWFIGRLNK